jgi:alkanesulfonate monooxygenase SsuD/methylene tetrahydromethanopterin reductase-like flavin-dependent oxidoreductase (luciferase family)
MASCCPLADDRNDAAMPCRSCDRSATPQRCAARLRRAGFINLAVSEDHRRAPPSGASSRIFSAAATTRRISIVRLDIDHAIMDANARHDLDAATALLPDAAVSAFACAGTPRQCHERLQEYLSIGLDEAVIEISGDADGAGLRWTIRDLAAQPTWISMSLGVMAPAGANPADVTRYMSST